MQGTDKIGRLKKFVDATVEATKQQELTGQTVGIEFSLGSAKGDITSSEAIAFMQCILGALSRFDEDLVAQFSFNLEIVHPALEAINESTRSRMKAIIELEANTPKLVTAK